MNLTELKQGLGSQGYIVDDVTATILQYSLILNKPLLIEGPAGAGKTELAKAWGQYLDRTLIRLQCYEGIDESKALYEWNYQKQLLFIQTQGSKAKEWSKASESIYAEEFLLDRPLLKAITSEKPTVLLIDEIDKSDEEFESFLLEILKQYYPEIQEDLGRQAVTFVRKLRLERLKKHPSISEVIDWVGILDHLGVGELTASLVTDTLNILLKHKEDCEKIAEKVQQEEWFSGIFNS